MSETGFEGGCACGAVRFRMNRLEKHWQIAEQQVGKFLASL
jgi:hypothetical protein